MKSTQDHSYITTDGFEALKSEYRKLLFEERPKVVEVVSWAAGNGDRSENGDYIYGKRRLREIDRRLRTLAQKLEKLKVVNPKEIINKSRVVFGTRVFIVDEDGVETNYQIVGEDETDAPQRKISWKSPMAKALLGKSVGDEVRVRRPKGDSWVEITGIE